MARRLVIAGAGGFARELKWMVREINAVAPTYEFAGFVLSDMQWRGATDSAEEIVGDFDWLRANRDRFDALALGVGDPRLRLDMLDRLRDAFDDSWWPALIHPTAIVDRESCRIGPGVQLCARVVATVNVDFAPFCMVNYASTIGHEARIGRGSVINPQAHVAGGVAIGEGVLVGSGAHVLARLEVGARATVGSGAVVTKSVPAGVTVVGVPARPVHD